MRVDPVSPAEKLFSACSYNFSGTVWAGESRFVRNGELFVIKLGRDGRSLSVPFEGRSPDPRRRDCCEPELSCGE